MQKAYAKCFGQIWAVIVLHCMMRFVMVKAQGLNNDPDSWLGATSAQAKLEAMYRGSIAFRNAYKLKASTACSSQKGSLCAAQTWDMKAQLLMATSPQAFDARQPEQMGGFSAVSSVKDQQGCNTCVAFTVLAAAESAVACATRRDSSSSMFSEQVRIRNAGCRRTAALPARLTCQCLLVPEISSSNTQVQLY